MSRGMFRAMIRPNASIVVASLLICGACATRAASIAPGVLAPVTAPSAPPASTGAYPPSRATDTADTLFGTVVRDPYRWLEDASSPEVKGWMKAQDDFARARLDRLPERDAIAARLRELDKGEVRYQFTRRAGGRLFSSRRTADQDKLAVVVREANGAERVLIDPNSWPGEGNPSVVDYVVSLDGKKIAYGVNLHNADESVTHVVDVDSGKELPDRIAGTNFFNVEFNGTSDGIYYRYTPGEAKLDQGERYGMGDLRFHRLGDAPSKDVVVHETMHDPHDFLWIHASQDGHWLFAVVDHGASILDVYFKSARGPQTSEGWVPLAVGRQASFDVTAYRDRFYVLTNDEASRSRVMVVDPNKPARAAWKELVPERADSTLTDARIVGGKLVLSYSKDVLPHVEIHELDGRLLREVTPPGIGTLWSLGGAQNKDDDTALYAFESFTSPPATFETSVKKGGSRPLFRQEVPFDGSKFVVEQRFCESKDGTRVPMFIVHARDDGGAAKKPAPTLLYAYGAYGSSEGADFRIDVIPWLEHGGTYVVANIRGGSEYGEAWHQAVVGPGKQRSFDDLAAVAEYLEREHFTTPEQLVIKGGSHGGLLVATELTQRPELFRAVICGVPLTDMIRYTKFGAGLLWRGEIGTPEVEGDFRALLAYSPYHNVKPGTAYPSLLVESADSDDRVDPMHARKFAAAVQNASDGGSVLLSIQREAGHHGSGKKEDMAERIADEYAFALAEIRERGSVLRGGR